MIETARIGVVLAGGRATRMGGEKAGIMLGGVTLLDRAIQAVEAAGLSARVCARADSELPPLATPVWREPARDDTHPLAGLAAALVEAGQPIVALPLDLPLLPAAVLGALAARPEPLAVLTSGGRPAALVLRATPEHAAALMRAAEAGAPALRTLMGLGAVGVELAELLPDASGHELLNVNDPSDWARAEALLA